MTNCPNCGHDLTVTITRDDLKTMSRQDIEAARREGRLNHILRGEDTTS